MQLTAVLARMEDGVPVADRLQIGEQVYNMRDLQVPEDVVGPVPAWTERGYGENTEEAC